MAKTITHTRAWLASLALAGAFAITGCGGGSPATPQATGNQGEASQASSQSQQPSASSSAGADNSADTYELTETYTDPDHLYTVKYPKTWKAQTNRGYLELTSPDGKVKGSVASTKVHDPKGARIARSVYPLIGDETELSQQTGSKVYSYSAYVPAPPRSDKKDIVQWGLTDEDRKGLAPLPSDDKREQLWAEFHYGPVNDGKPALNQTKAVELVHKVNDTDEAGAVDAILKSVRSTQE